MPYEHDYSFLRHFTNGFWVYIVNDKYTVLVSIGGSKMQTRRIGNLQVSPIGMGCMGFSHGYGPVPDEQDSIASIRAAYEHGCTLFDTAESYGEEMFYPGHNEQLVGKALKPFRDKISLATKFHISDDEADTGRDLSQTIHGHIEHSLKNLDTDHVDIYYLHRVNEKVPLDDVVAVMGSLIDEGLIREWGLSQVSADTLAGIHADHPLAAVQNIYSMVERDAEEDVIPYCLDHDMALVAFSPTSSGLLAGSLTIDSRYEGDDVRRFVPQLSPENFAANQPLLDLLHQVAGRKGATVAQISLAWMLRKYPNVVPIPGSRKLSHILENLDSWQVTFTDDEFSKLDQAIGNLPVHGHRGQVETQQHSFGDNWASKAGTRK